MLKVSQLMQMPVYSTKHARSLNQGQFEEKDLVSVGKVRQVVCSPKGDQVVGLLVRRPDVAGMVKRPDAFVALDSISTCDQGLVVMRDRNKQGMDQEAIDRLGLDWDACILWTGMDAKTTDGKELGWVDDIEFDAKSGRVRSFFVGDGSVAKSLVGSVVIPANMLRGYDKGFMLVDPAAARLALNGGLAAKAGESYARTRHEGKKVAAKAAKTVGKRLGKTRGMFGAFMDEYRKASK